jgi:acetylornithine/N-succinyldiaminopimelate aminotransferase
VAKALVPGMHATTYGGSALVCAAGLTVFQVIEDEGLLENTVKMGGRFVDGLKKLQQKDARIKEIRAVGLMIGVELTVPGAPVVQAALEEQLLINCTHETILRIAPSLNITAEEVDEGLARLERALAAVEVAAQ